MNKVTKANIYSDAIFDIAQQDNSILTWVNFLEELSKLMSDLSVASFFQDPKIRIAWIIDKEDFMKKLYRRNFGYGNHYCVN